MTTLNTQYRNYLKDMQLSQEHVTYDYWLYNIFNKKFETFVPDDFQIGPDGAYNYEEDPNYVKEKSKVMEDIKIIHLKSNAQRLETWIAMVNGDIVGHIYMEREENEKIKFLDAWVHEDHRRKGIFRSLWDARWDYVQAKYQGYLVYAWCKPASLPLLLEKGFDAGETCTYVEKIVE